jgi:hypothetical protein
MVMTGENLLYSTKNVPVPLLSIKNPTWTDREWNLSLRGELPVTERPNHGMALKTASDVNCILKTQPVPHSKHTPSVL